MMTSKERVMGAFNRTGYDRIPIKHEGTSEINQMLMEHFGVAFCSVFDYNRNYIEERTFNSEEIVDA